MENVLVLDQKKYKIEIVDKAQTRADISFNIILIGDSGVGKSCFSIRAIKDEFIEQIEGTYFISYDIKINNRSMCIQDVCGQDIYKSLVSNYYKNISIAILMYAINDRESFDNIKSWLDDVKHQSRNDVMIILVGNKTDLEEERKVTKEEGEKFKEDNKLDLFMETSAKTGNNTKKVLIEAAKLLYGEFGENIKVNKCANQNITLSKKNNMTPESVSVKSKKSKCI